MTTQPERQTPAEERVRRLAEGWCAWVLTEMEEGGASFERIQAVRECAVAVLKALDGPQPATDPLGDPVECYACGKPIAAGEGMIGSDVFGVYSHQACEQETRRKWLAENPPPVELEQARRTLGRYASDPRFSPSELADPMLANLGDCQSPPAASLRVEAVDADEDEC